MNIVRIRLGFATPNANPPARNLVAGGAACVVHAMRNPAARCLSHPTGRIIGHRAENALDLDRTFETTLQTGVALELHGLPSRLDLAAENLRGAIAAGRRVVCSSDGLGDLRRPHRPPRRSTRSRRCRHPAVHCLRDAKR